jgi:hypothetical protein
MTGDLDPRDFAAMTYDVRTYPCRERHVYRVDQGHPAPDHCPICGVSPATVERIDHEWDRRVVFRADCRACNLRVNFEADARDFQRDRDDEEPTPEQAASAAWRVIDHFTGGPERRARRREVEAAEKRYKARARGRLAAGGCQHALAATPASTPGDE